MLGLQGKNDTERRGSQDHSPLSAYQPKSILQLQKCLWKERNQKVFVRDHLVNYLRPQLTKGQFESYFKFAFIRNPWDRTYSWYRNIMRDPIHRKKRGINSDISFDDFLKKHGSDWALKPQSFWLTNLDGSIETDDLGRFETFETDMDRIGRKIGLKSSSIPFKNNSVSVDYRQAFSSFAQEWVASRHKEDIENFDYHF